MALTPGASFGPYVIADLLGAGGMGTVYRARDPRLDRVVALKLLPADAMADPDRRRRFEREAKAASSLNHPAIVTIYEFGSVGDQPYISMELVEGRTLRQLLGGRRPALRDVVRWAAQIAAGMAKAHQHEIVHRDLKPENIIVTRDDHAKILDFGVARVRPAGLLPDPEARTQTSLDTQPGAVLGTASYMSPEQAAGEAAGPQSDQFSFGAVLYELLTGRRAFEAANAVDAMAAVRHRDLPPISQVDPALPAPLEWIVERCLAKRPADRYASTDDLAKDLEGLQARLPALGSASRPALPPAGPRRRWLAGAGWTAAGVLAVALVVQWLGPREAGPVPPRLEFPVEPPAGYSIYSPGVYGSPVAVSPDGRRIVFIATAEAGGRQLWLRSLDSTTAQPLPDTEGAVEPFWSPDSASVGFFTEQSLRRIRLTDGVVDTICDATLGAGAAWNQDDVIVFAPRLEASLFRVAAGGGVPAPVTTLDAAARESLHAWPVFLPDGNRFVFLAGGEGRWGIYAGSLDSKNTTLVMPRRIAQGEISTLAFAEPDTLLFVERGVLYAQALDLERLVPSGEPIRITEDVLQFGPAAAFSASRNGVIAYWPGTRILTQLEWRARDGTVLETVATPQPFIHVALSSDGRQVALDRWESSTSNIWLVDSRQAMSKLTSEGSGAMSPVWSPAGEAVAFAASRETSPNLYLVRLATGAVERLATTRFQTFPNDWSPDGRFLVYSTIEPGTGSDLWRLPMTGAGAPEVLLRTGAHEYGARVSPDGRWLAHTSDKSGRNEIYVTRFPAPDAGRLVSMDGGADPAWRGDSREIYYRAGNVLMAAAVEPRGDDVAFGTPTRLFVVEFPPLLGRGVGSPYAASTDGQRFLVNRLDTTVSPPLTVVVNWPGR